jgi:hypothetical protein
MKPHPRFCALLLLLCLSVTPCFAAEGEDAPGKGRGKRNKGKLYVFWGWNRAHYTDSDIHFTGDAYDFTLKCVAAKDKQTPFSFEEYLEPTNLTGPQTNVRVGYFFAEHWDIAIGVDHMKYVMQQNQTVKADGYIANSGTQYDGVYFNEDVVLTDDFLTFEHTDGLNYVFVEINRSDELLRKAAENLWWLKLEITEGFSAGALYPKTNTKLLGNERHDAFHLSGYGLALKVGLRLTLVKYLLVQSEAKGGFIHMPDIRTTSDPSDRASQHFGFFQYNILLGVAIPLTKQ